MCNGIVWFKKAFEISIKYDRSHYKYPLNLRAAFSEPRVGLTNVMETNQKIFFLSDCTKRCLHCNATS